MLRAALMSRCVLLLMASAMHVSCGYYVGGFGRRDPQYREKACCIRFWPASSAMLASPGSEGNLIVTSLNSGNFIADEPQG
jgi:hypothetical protein